MTFTPVQIAAIRKIAEKYGIKEMASEEQKGIFLDTTTRVIVNCKVTSKEKEFKGLPEIGITDMKGFTDENAGGRTVDDIRDEIRSVLKALPKEKFKPKVEHDSKTQGQNYTGTYPGTIPEAPKVDFTPKERPTAPLIDDLKNKEKKDESKTPKAQDVSPPVAQSPEPEIKKATIVKMCRACGFALEPKRAMECFERDPQEPVFICAECEANTPAPRQAEVMPSHERSGPPSRTILGKVVTQKGLMIKNLTLKCAEIGGIRIGTKGENTTGSGYRLPQKLDHFIVTTPNKDKAGNFILDDVMSLLPENPRILDIMMLYDDETMNFSTQYREMKGGRVVCSGDGEKAFDKEAGQEIICNTDTCPKYLAKKCKLNGTLSVILLNKPTIGGVYRFRTTGWNSVQSIMTSMLMIKTLTRGLLAMIPLKLTLTPKLVTPKGTDKAHTIYFVNIEYHGSDLLEQVIKISNHRMAMQSEIKKLETQSLLSAPESEEELKDIQDEFYPGQV